MLESRLAVVVLAAGQGTRMRSSKPKVMHELAGIPLLGHALHTASALQAAHVVAVVRHEKDLIGGYVNAFFGNVKIAEQDEIPGTGRAAECGLNALPTDFEGVVVITSGDVPLLDVATIEALLETHLAEGLSATLLTTYLEDPTGYGRILRSNDGEFIEIVEQRDANEGQLEIDEVNAGVYVFDASSLRAALAHIGTHNAQGEKYLTDAAAQILKSGGKVQAIAIEDAWLVAGINDRVQLSEVAAELNYRICEAWQLAGVTIVDPANTYIDVTVQLAEDVTLLPGTHLKGISSIGAGATVGPEVYLVDSSVGQRASVVKSHITTSRIGDDASVGPFAYLRPGTDLGADGKIGTFVETKNAIIGAGSKVPHLSYVGDAEIGEDSNIGAGTIFANYDGVNKHRSRIGRGVRSGSHNVFVAPVTIGDGAYTAAGTVVRKDVAAGSLAMNVSPQRNLPDWVVANRAGTASAEAAAATQKASSESTEQD